MHENYPMWKYWFLTEGVLGVDPKTQLTNDGKMPPVIHVDSDAPLYSCNNKSKLITDKLWGIYYKYQESLIFYQKRRILDLWPMPQIQVWNY